MSKCGFSITLHSQNCQSLSVYAKSQPYNWTWLIERKSVKVHIDWCDCFVIALTVFNVLPSSGNFPALLHLFMCSKAFYSRSFWALHFVSDTFYLSNLKWLNIMTFVCFFNNIHIVSNAVSNTTCLSLTSSLLLHYAIYMSWP